MLTCMLLLLPCLHSFGFLTLLIDVDNEEFWVTGSDSGTLTRDSVFDPQDYVFWSFFTQQSPLYGMNLTSGSDNFPDSIPVDASNTGTPINYADTGLFELEYVTASVAEEVTGSGNKFGAFGIVGLLGASGTLTVTGAGYSERVSYSGLHDKSFFEAMIGQSVPFVVNPDDPATGWSNLEVVAGVPEPSLTSSLFAGAALLFGYYRFKSRGSRKSRSL